MAGNAMALYHSNQELVQYAGTTAFMGGATAVATRLAGVLGVSVEDASGISVADVFPSQDIGAWHEALEAAFTQGAVTVIQSAVDRGPGGMRNLHKAVFGIGVGAAGAGAYALRGGISEAVFELASSGDIPVTLAEVQAVVESTFNYVFDFIMGGESAQQAAMGAAAATVSMSAAFTRSGSQFRGR